MEINNVAETRSAASVYQSSQLTAALTVL